MDHVEAVVVAARTFHVATGKRPRTIYLGQQDYREIATLKGSPMLEITTSMLGYPVDSFMGLRVLTVNLDHYIQVSF